LVEISPNISPPICKIIDYLKFKYQQKRKQKEVKAKSQKIVVKEIRFTPTTDDHDFNFKLKHAIKFLQEGAKIRVFMIFSRGSIQSKDRGELLLLNFAKELESYGKVDQLPKFDEKKQGGPIKMLLTMSPKSTKN
jgi:translation initiation factor IF-3